MPPPKGVYVLLARGDPECRSSVLGKPSVLSAGMTRGVIIPPGKSPRNQCLKPPALQMIPLLIGLTGLLSEERLPCIVFFMAHRLSCC